ncbi:hypothetical protein [Planococcus halotolerans]|uniref:Uncharacterized protein n=1 Tax=Planococcus halotolerans TaxID=2233542 RepID=A0A365KWT1_9BACL|nr:hypothetical protein [Planococcus halotolerans]QHJ69157.1 hypothetical protein DNR44_000200 [Planococcus halotolerans]RAZ77641.1 hypothetical protein DP120_09160 [Planococcus halotolerans]
MLKKILIGAFIFFIGFTIKNVRNGEKMILEDILLLAGVALVVFAFKEWVEVPYDWDKHKNKNKDKDKNKEKKNLN